jgi:NAD(P)-dependent dehydrogenase (short-subunit alcohol dehydrogenase family)
MSRINGKAAIVTGGAQGIGGTFARALADAGASVVLADIVDPSPLAEEITRSGGRAIGIIADVGNPADCVAVAKRTVDEFGRLDILVANAALSSRLEHKPFDQITVDEWDAVMRINVRGPFSCAQACFPYMKAARYGKIVTLASSVVFAPSPNWAHYVTSKGAIVALTRALARELGEYGICVNSISPGLTMSENILAQEGALAGSMQRAIDTRSIKREETPADLVGTLLFLVGPESDFLTGQTISVDGGFITR